jgi:hypothetical protein
MKKVEKEALNKINGGYRSCHDNHNGTSTCNYQHGNVKCTGTYTYNYMEVSLNCTLTSNSNQI